LLRGKLFARQLDRVSENDIISWVEELAKNKLLFLYTHVGERFIQMNTWEQGRAKQSRFPQPPTDVNKCLQMYAHENKCPDSDTDTDSDTECESLVIHPSASATQQKNIYSEDFKAFWKAYPRKVGKLAAAKAWAHAKEKPTMDIILAAIDNQRKCQQWIKDGGDFIPHPATWLNQGRWDDELTTSKKRGPNI